MQGSKNEVRIDQLMTPDDLGKLVPSRRKGKTTSAQTIRRWMHQGLKGVFLKYKIVGSIPCSSQEFLDDFFDQLTKADEKRRFCETKELPENTKPETSDLRLKHFQKKAGELGL